MEKLRGITNTCLGVGVFNGFDQWGNITDGTLGFQMILPAQWMAWGHPDLQ